MFSITTAGRVPSLESVHFIHQCRSLISSRDYEALKYLFNKGYGFCLPLTNALKDTSEFCLLKKYSLDRVHIML